MAFSCNGKQEPPNILLNWKLLPVCKDHLQQKDVSPRVRNGKLAPNQRLNRESRWY
jgi:hypothetical protein